jgi:hypothetical protein
VNYAHPCIAKSPELLGGQHLDCFGHGFSILLVGIRSSLKVMIEAFLLEYDSGVVPLLDLGDS